MARKRSMDAPVRSSPRIANLPKPAPEPAEPKEKKRESKPRAQKHAAEAVEDEQPAEEVTPSKKRGRPSKKTQADVSTSQEKESVTEEEVVNKEQAPQQQEAPISSPASDFEVVSKESLPSPNSEEVKKAIDAQGSDGNLLVDVVQVTKADIPAATSDEIKDINKQLDNACVKKPAVEEPALEVMNVNGCNGNCGIEKVNRHEHEESHATNGISLASEETNGKQHTESATIVDNAPVA